jgi:hypothetical protein
MYFYEVILMHKIIYKLYDGEPVDENAKGCASYLTEFKSLSGAKRTLRTMFGVGPESKEALVPKLVDRKVMESYLVPDFDVGISARFYILEEDD